MGKGIWILIGALIVGGGYFGWKNYGGAGVASYTAEKLADRICKDIIREIRMEGTKPDAAVEKYSLQFIEEAKTRVGRTFTRQEFRFGIEGKQCKGAVVIKNGDKEETLRVQVDFPS